MSVQVYGCNHVAIEVGRSTRRSSFIRMYSISRSSTKARATHFSSSAKHQFLAMFEVEQVKRDGPRHFGIMVRDEQQLAEVRDKLTNKYGIKLIPPFRCDFRDPWGNRVQVVDLHDESLVWLLPYQEVQKAGIGLTVRKEETRNELADHRMSTDLTRTGSFTRIATGSLHTSTHTKAD